MPHPSFMQVEGEKQGLITKGAFTQESVGNVFKAGFQDYMMVQAINHETIRPTDPQTGQPTGNPIQKPLKVTTSSTNRATPLLHDALNKGEKLPVVTLKKYRTDVNGQPEHCFTITLRDAILIRATEVSPDAQDESMGHKVDETTWEFTYEKIERVHEVSNTLSHYTWKEHEQEAGVAPG